LTGILLGDLSWHCLALVQAWVAENGLTLHPTKTKIVEARTEGFDFLGYRFVNGRRYVRRKSLDKFKDSIRRKTRRTRGGDVRTIIASVNPTLRGWFEYFKQSYRTTFRILDGWVRMRLRSILRRRKGKRGRGRGSDHKKWPNAFFAEQGLFSLVNAHALAVQSSRR
jgi:RNA-directed DNA polymerase